MTQHHQRADQTILFIVVAFLLFSFSFYFLHYSNIISGAGISGTVNFTILPSGGPSGEPGGRIIKDKSKILSFDLEVTQKKIAVHAAQHDYTLFRLRLIHHGTSPFDLVFSTNVLALKILEERVSLDPGEEKEVILRIDTTKTGVFLGVLTLEDVFVFKQLPVLIQIDHVDFHVTVDIPNAVENILPGQDIYADVTIEPLFGENLTLSYTVQDSSGHSFLTEEERTTVQGTSTSFRKTLSFPAPLPLGDYFLVVRAEQVGKKAEGVDAFTVVDSLTPRREFPARLYYQNPLVFFLIVLAILFLHVVMTWRKKK